MTDTPFSGDQLLAMYDRVAGAEDAIPRLRRFVLDLAVRGKLVEQDAGDEPASKLLERIEAEKVRLVKAGEIKKSAVDPVELKDEPHQLPKNWAWVRFASIADFSAGRTPARNESSFWNTGDYPWVSIADMKDGEILTATKETISERARQEVFKSEPVPIGTMIMSFKLTIGKISRLGVSAFHNEAIITIRPILNSLDELLFITLPELARGGDTKGAIKGATLNRESLSNLCIPLPPLAEQHRIVAKVQELMALLDGLEVARVRAEGARDKLTAATLHRLTDEGTDPQTATAFALKTLPALTTRAGQIKPLRQTILNLAVRGKLVEQDEGDEPASVLLEQLRADRGKLLKEKGVRTKKPVDPLRDIDDLNLPCNWTADAFANLIDPRETISYGVLVPGPDEEGGVPFVRAQDLALSGHPSRPNKTISLDIERKYARTRLRGGEILLCVVGSIGKLGVVPPEWAGANIARAVARISPMEHLSRDFVLLFLRSDLAQSYFEDATRTHAQPTLNVGLIEKLPFPLPPLA
ncbi:MAG: restriction endonuclease subunit S [Rhodobacteraceae bacterium]|nr:restriction endonuclease subunit S [Paracoccaceae bacterium]